MSDFLIAFLATASASTWVYTKAQRRTGGNTRNALMVAVAMGVIVFIVMMTILNLVANSLEN